MMSVSQSGGTGERNTILAEGEIRRIRFVRAEMPAREVVASFADPSPHHAVSLEAGPEAADHDGIDVLLVARPPQEQVEWADALRRWVGASAPAGSIPPVTITHHGAHIVWSPTHAAILAAPDRIGSFLRVVVDFAYHENELRKLEREIGARWSQLEQDTPLAHEVDNHDPERFAAIGQRMQETLSRRMRLSRIEPHLYRPRFHLTPLENQLLERLWEKAHVEDRMEAVDSQLEVFEQVYEMNSQKISEFKIARQERTLEWIIIVLLATETILLLVDLLSSVSPVQ